MTNILLVDDQGSILQGLKQHFVDHGFHVTTASDAESVLEKTDACAGLDVIITDLRLPGASGLDLIRHLKSSNPGLICCIMSAYVTLEDAIQAMRLGVQDIFPKPFQSEEMLTRINQYLQDRVTLPKGDTQTSKIPQWNCRRGWTLGTSLLQIYQPGRPCWQVHTMKGQGSQRLICSLQTIPTWNAVILGMQQILFNQGASIEKSFSQCQSSFAEFSGGEPLRGLCVLEISANGELGGILSPELQLWTRTRPEKRGSALWGRVKEGVFHVSSWEDSAALWISPANECPEARGLEGDLLKNLISQSALFHRLAHLPTRDLSSEKWQGPGLYLYPENARSWTEEVVVDGESWIECLLRGSDFLERSHVAAEKRYRLTSAMADALHEVSLQKQSEKGWVTWLISKDRKVSATLEFDGIKEILGQSPAKARGEEGEFWQIPAHQDFLKKLKVQEIGSKESEHVCYLEGVEK